MSTHLAVKTLCHVIRIFTKSLKIPTSIVQFLIGLLLLTAIAFPVSTVALEPPPPPKQDSSELRLPDPVPYERIRAEASLPQTIPLGFAIDLDGMLVSGHWDISGEVVGLDREARKITFITNQGDTGHLVYRLPSDLTVPLAINDPVVIKRKVQDYGIGTGYEMQITGADGWILAAGRVFGGSPRGIVLRNGVNIIQQEVSAENDKEKFVYDVPITFSAGVRNDRLPENKIKKLNLLNTTYTIFVFESKYIASQDLNNSWGYMLEYAVTSE